MIIGISGKAGSGKDTAAEYLYDLIKERMCEKYGKETTYCVTMAMAIRHFAKPLKEVALCLLHRPTKEEFKTSELPEEFQFYGMNTGRDFLQVLGTEVFRKWDSDFWLRVFKYKYLHSEILTHEVQNAPKFSECFKNWNGEWLIIIPDVRFKNEYDFIKEQGGVMWRIERPNIETMSHSSETDLDNEEFDVIIHNRKTLNEFYEQIEQRFNEQFC